MDMDMGMEVGTMVGQTLRRWRQEAGMRQEDLERATGIAQEYISAVELGRIAEPGARRLRRLVRALGHTLDDLYALCPDDDDVAA